MKNSIPTANIQPNPTDRVTCNLEEAHFAIGAVSIPSANNMGLVFQASQAQQLYTSELGFTNSQPQASWVDVNRQSVQLTSPTRQPISAPSVLAFTSVPGSQTLRVNSAVVPKSSATFAPSPFNQMLIGWGYRSYHPRDGFKGFIYAVITGKGKPSSDELAVLERFLGTTAGVTLK